MAVGAGSAVGTVGVLCFIPDRLRNLAEVELMDSIESFQVDHTKLLPGLYISRQDFINTPMATTYDIRMRRPNVEEPLSTAVMHTIEHIGAVFLRNYSCLDVIYFGPMGCRTGFYLVVAGHPDDETLLATMQDLFMCVLLSTEVPGATEEECGNAADHDLEGAKRAARDYLDGVLNQIRKENDVRLDYAGKKKPRHT